MNDDDLVADPSPLEDANFTKDLADHLASRPPGAPVPRPEIAAELEA